MTGGDGDVRAVLMTQVAQPEGLAAAAALHRVPLDVVPTAVGALGVCRDTTDGAPEHAARVVSGLLRNTPVVLLVHRGGRMTATRWQSGTAGDGISPALLLDGAPAEVEGLLLGWLDAADAPGTVSSVGMSRRRAVGVLLRSARLARAGRRA